MKPTKKELALEADSDRLCNVCCIALKYNSLVRTMPLAASSESLEQLVEFMGYKHAQAVARFAQTLP